MIRELIACEHEYINTDHPDFIGGTRAVKVTSLYSISERDAESGLGMFDYWCDIWELLSRQLGCATQEGRKQRMRMMSLTQMPLSTSAVLS